MRILDKLADLIAARLTRKRKHYWMGTFVTKSKDPKKCKEEMYCRWFCVSEDAIYPYRQVMSDFSVMYKQSPTLISVIEISESDYNALFLKR